MRLRGLLLCGVLCLLAAQGCDRRIPDSELGHVNFELPKVPGADKPPPTPELDELERDRPAATAEAPKPPVRRHRRARTPQGTQTAPDAGAAAGGC